MSPQHRCVRLQRERRCSQSASLLSSTPPPLVLFPSCFAADQCRHALNNSAVCLRNCRGSLEHCVCWSEFGVRWRLSGLHSRTRACVTVKNARNSAVCSTARCSCTHVKLAYAPPAAFGCVSLFDAPCAGDGQFVAAYDAAQRLHCINAETNHVIALDPVAGTPTALCWHPRESLLAVSLLGTNALRPHICAPALLFLGIS